MNQINELFTNVQIDLSGLPEAEQMEMIPLEPAYKTVRYISAALVAVVFLLGSWIFALSQPDLFPYGLIVAGLMTLISAWIVMYAGIAFDYKGYAVREKDITYKSGWLWKSMTTVPFNRVQHCDLRQGILDRRFNLSKLTIYTAGGQSTDLMIPGLLPDTAEKLKIFILKSTEQSIEEE
ncbi:MAG: PH domain-containing protein [Saprospiraceae bacterium]|nr:PH domain-containing protein [Saprospiraceae bacterium]